MGWKSKLRTAPGPLTSSVPSGFPFTLTFLSQCSYTASRKRGRRVDPGARILLAGEQSYPIFAMLPVKSKPLRRMKLEELIAKMEQIEEQARLTLDEYPHGLTKERVRLVMALAKQVRAHVTDQLEAGARDAISEEIRVAVLGDRKAANSGS